MLNGVAYDFENHRFDIGGTEIKVSSISSEHGFETSKQFASDREEFDETEGVYQAEPLEVTMPIYQYYNLIETLGPGYMSKAARFDGASSYAHEGEPVKTDIYQRCRMVRDAHDHSQGPDGLEVSVTFSVKKILRAGIDPVQR